MQKGVSAAFLLSQLAAHQHAHDGGHHQAAGPAGRVAEAVQALDVGVEVPQFVREQEENVSGTTRGSWPASLPLPLWLCS